MGLRLSKEMEELLREVINKHCPDLMVILDHPEQVRMTDFQRDELRQAVTDEFIETGLQENDEPNKRGLLLEDLIDRLGHF